VDSVFFISESPYWSLWRSGSGGRSHRIPFLVSAAAVIPSDGSRMSFSEDANQVAVTQGARLAQRSDLGALLLAALLRVGAGLPGR
jgi:hypothetical protein